MIRGVYVSLGLSLLMLSACRPAKSGTETVEARLVALEERSAALQNQVDVLRADQGALDRDADTAAIERRRVRGQSDDVAARVAALEEAQKKPAQAPRAGRPDPDARYQATVGDAHTRGPSNALVTIVAFSDFQCPFCGRAVPTLEAVEKKYGNDVRIVFKHNPLPMHNRARAAALAAEAAGRQGKFWKMHDLLFDDQRALTDENFMRFAKKLRLRKKQFKRDMADAGLGKKIDEHQAQATRIGARGTPAFFINGRFLSGAQPLQAFSELIDVELSHAERMVAQGTARADVYARLMEEARPGV